MHVLKALLMIFKLQEFLKQTKVEFVGGLGLGGGIRTMYRQLSILDTEERALKLSDLWIKEGKMNRNIIVRNRFTKEIVNIPIDCLVPSLRRPSGVGYMDVTESSDFLVEDTFLDMDRFFNDTKAMKNFVKNKAVWKEYVERRLGGVFMARKFDISAPGTRLLCFYSSAPLVPGEFWLIRNLSSDFARVFCLWINSTPNLVQMFINRTETRGAWMKSDIRTLRDTYVIDPRVLTTNEKNELLNTFSKMSRCAFPSLTEQLKTMHPARREIDKLILRIIGFDESEIVEMIDRLYPVLYDEIERLKTLMEG